MTSKEVDFKIVDLILATGTLPKESRNNPVFHDCIHELSALPIYRLSSEPSYLRDCHKRVIEESHKLAYDNYSTFIHTAECTNLIFKDFEDVEKKNELLTGRIPNFVDSCNALVEKFRKSISIANMNSLTLKNHTQILEILEIPQLLEACIRNNYIDEALEVIAHTRRLERRHQNIDIVKDVARESRLAAQKLLDQLFQQLGGSLQLPACLKIVGYMRRMDCLPDSLLRLKFFQCRDNYLKNLLHSVPTNDPFFHATKYMEITRVNLFDMATQYRAVFNDEDVYVSQTDMNGCHQGTLFASWLVMRVRAFLTSLSDDLDSIVQNSMDYSRIDEASHRAKSSSSQSVGSKLQSLLGQAMYFGLSLSRIGSDFRALLIPVFYEAVMKYVELRLDEIPAWFATCICSHRWAVSVEPSEPYSLAVAIRTTNQLIAGPPREEIGAPVVLMNHPLLAVLLNQLLSVLEEIRLCCPWALRQRIWQAFSVALDKVGLALLKHYQDHHHQHQLDSVTPPGNGVSRQWVQFEAMLGALLCHLVPHVNLCLAALFRDASAGNNSDTGEQADLDRDQSRSNGHRHRCQVAIDVTKLASGLRAVLPEVFFETDAVSAVDIDERDDEDHRDAIVVQGDHGDAVLVEEDQRSITNEHEGSVDQHNPLADHDGGTVDNDKSGSTDRHDDGGDGNSVFIALVNESVVSSPEAIVPLHDTMEIAAHDDTPPCADTVNNGDSVAIGDDAALVTSSSSSNNTSVNDGVVAIGDIHEADQ